MRSDTISFAPGSDGGFAAGCSTGFVVAALKAFSASLRLSRMGPRAMIIPYHTLPVIVMPGHSFPKDGVLSHAYDKASAVFFDRNTPSAG
jgi:hypothetical protein